MPTSRQPTAQTTYADMLRGEIGPRLRALGFKGSAGKYILPDPDRWLMIGFQKDYYSRFEEVSFTVNVTAADKQAWVEAHAAQAWLPERPSGNSHYFVQRTTVIRLGNLMPPRGEDRWWEVRPGQPTTSVSAQVLDAIERRALPWLRSVTPGPAASRVTFADTE